MSEPPAPYTFGVTNTVSGTYTLTAQNGVVPLKIAIDFICEVVGRLQDWMDPAEFDALLLALSRECQRVVEVGA